MLPKMGRAMFIFHCTKEPMMRLLNVMPSVYAIEMVERTVARFAEGMCFCM